MSKTIFDSGRLPARWSVILMNICFVSTCLGNLFDAKWGGPLSETIVFWIGNAVGLLTWLGSIGLGGLGAARGWREKNWDTVIIACIGLFLATGMSALFALCCYVLSQNHV